MVCVVDIIVGRLGILADSYMFTCSIGDNTADFCAALLSSVFFIPDKESSN